MTRELPVCFRVLGELKQPSVAWRLNRQLSGGYGNIDVYLVFWLMSGFSAQSFDIVTSGGLVCVCVCVRERERERVFV